RAGVPYHSYEGFPVLRLLKLGVEMKRKHLFVFYCSLLVPMSVLAHIIHSQSTATGDTPATAVLFASRCPQHTVKYACGTSMLRTQR
ncbi:MAG: hypothetical protein LJE95_11900, partial [Acidobacteria bacterium]|nr:hypothetical protein [Acidobacteriota bacterium]